MGLLHGKFGGSVPLGRHVVIKHGYFYIQKHQNFDFRGFVDFYKVIGATQISYYWAYLQNLGAQELLAAMFESKMAAFISKNTKSFFFFLLLSSSSFFFLLFS